MTATLCWLALTVLAEPAVVGEAHGLVVRVRPLASPRAAGEVLRVRATPCPDPGLFVRHGGELGQAARDGLAAVATWLTGPSADSVTGLPVAASRQGVAIRFAGRPDPVDGASASLAIAVATASALLQVPVRPEVALSGVVAADGAVLPVEGAVAKAEAAYAAGYRALLLPLDNARELLAEDPLWWCGRLQVIGVTRVEAALREAWGAAGPFAAEFTDYHALHREGLELLAGGDPSGAARRFGACLDYEPLDLSAAFWREQCQAAMTNPLARAAALRRLGRHGDALEELRVATGGGRDRHRLEKLTLDTRRDEAIALRRGLLAAAASDLAAGRLAEARARVVAAQATLAAAPEGREALRQADAELRCAETRQAALREPGEPRRWLAAADAAAGAERWDEVAEALHRAGAAGAVSPELLRREGEAWLRLGERETARARLLDNVRAWPADEPSRALLGGLGLDLLPPLPACTLPGAPVSGVVRLQAGAAEATARVTLELDDRDLGGGVAPYEVRWDSRAAGPGGHLLRVVARDEVGNAAWQDQPVVVEGPAAGAVGRGLAGSHPPFDVHLVTGGTWLLRAGDRLVIAPQTALAPGLRAVGRRAEEVQLGVQAEPAVSLAAPADLPTGPDTPYRWIITRGERIMAATTHGGAAVTLEPADVEGRDRVAVWGQVPEGPALGPVAVRLVRDAGLLATITEVSSADRAAVRVQVDPAFEPVVGWLLVDGRVVQVADPARLVLPDLAPGRHAVAVALADGHGQRCQTPPRTITRGPWPSGR